jgi:hypothetical protein
MLRSAFLAAGLLLLRQVIFGGVVLDSSFATSGALPGPNYMIGANLGKQVGNNLFQSFNQFNLISSESATFTGPSNIQNIVSRVTGGSPSSIDGVINSEIQGRFSRPRLGPGPMAVTSKLARTILSISGPVLSRRTQAVMEAMLRLIRFSLF